MDQHTRRELLDHGLEDPHPNGVYVILSGPTGVLLEDLAPFLESFEALYRRMFSIAYDPNVRKLLAQRVEEERPLHGVSRSINASYRAMVMPKPSDYRAVHADKKPVPVIRRQTDYRASVADEKSLLTTPRQIDSGRPKPGAYEQLFVRRPRPKIAEPDYAPRRIELARSRISSPGWIELLGDAGALALIFSFFGWLLTHERLRGEHSDRMLIDWNREVRDNVRLLSELGYSRQEIAAIGEYTLQDIGRALRKLEEGGMRLALGDELERKVLGPGNQEPEEEG